MKRKLLLLSGFTIILLFTAMVMTKSTRAVVVCFGDSITHGAKVNGHSWVYFLAKEHQNIDFVNEGRNGRKTSDKDEMLPVLKEYPRPYAFLIFLGVNDLKDGDDSMVNSCVENMKWMIEKVRKSGRGTKIFILAPCEINVKTMSSVNVRKRYNENTARSLKVLEIRYRMLAGKESVGFISLLRAVSPSNYVDGLHPDVTGQKEIAAAVWESFRSLFRAY